MNKQLISELERVLNGLVDEVVSEHPEIRLELDPYYTPNSRPVFKPAVTFSLQEWNLAFKRIIPGLEDLSGRMAKLIQSRPGWKEVIALNGQIQRKERCEISIIILVVYAARAKVKVPNGAVRPRAFTAKDATEFHKLGIASVGLVDLDPKDD